MKEAKSPNMLILLVVAASSGTNVSVVDSVGVGGFDGASRVSTGWIGRQAREYDAEPARSESNRLNSWPNSNA
jgi:hypothetical protein